MDIYGREMPRIQRTRVALKVGGDGERHGFAGN